MGTGYLETSIIGYLASRISADLVTAANQQLTRDWWDNHRDRFELFVSEAVVAECAKGDPTAAEERAEFLGDLPVLDIDEDCHRLASNIIQGVSLPEKADVDAIHIVDGSGLSYENRVSPTSLVAALRSAADSFRFGPEFSTALPVPGGDGTLEQRAAGAERRLRAKTGLLKRVTALSGYARRSDGSSAIFSLIVNDFQGDAESAMSAVDGFAAALVRPPG